MLSLSSCRTLRFYSRILKNLKFLGGFQKLSKQEGKGECSIQFSFLKGKWPFSSYSFFLKGKGGRSKKILKYVYVIYECPLRLHFLRNFEESSKNLKTIDLILTSNFEADTEDPCLLRSQFTALELTLFM